MTTAIAPPPTSSALAPPSIDVPHAGSRTFASVGPSTSSPAGTPNGRSNRPSSGHSPASNERSPQRRRSSDGNGNSSPPSTSKAAAAPPKVVVKKEPDSPELATSRHRPRRLDLSKSATSQPSTGANGRPSGGPLTSKESAGLAIQDLGLQCLSPGFHTQDPAMREQLQRSMNVREQQRQLIEARQKGGTKGSVATPPDHGGDGGLFRPNKVPGSSRRKGPPPGLSIAAPSAAQFASERVIQSAPLNQTFTGLNRNIHPVTRHLVNQPTPLSNTSHIHHQPAVQTNNRLPPITDVFPGDSFPNGPHSSRAAAFPHHSSDSPSHSSHGTQHQPQPSPGFPPPHQQHGPFAPPHASNQTSHPQSSTQHSSSERPREYRSAEEALSQMAGGREDLLPRIVHYGGHQPPTPPSPMTLAKGGGHPRDGLAAPSGGGSGSSHDGTTPSLLLRSRRRNRDEFERDMSPPSSQHPHHHHQPHHLGPVRRRTSDELRAAAAAADREAMWTDGRWERDSPETRQRKKERFIGLCSEAWDLFHS